MFKKMLLALSFLTVGAAAHATPDVSAPLWSCAINADLQATQSFPLPVLSLVRVWKGLGTVECVTPQGTFIRNIEMKITKVGPAIGLDDVGQMTFVVPQIGVNSLSEIFTDYSFGPSIDATAILVRGEVGVGVVLRSTGGLAVQGAIGAGPAVGLKLGVSVLGSAEIKDLGPATGLF